MSAQTYAQKLKDPRWQKKRLEIMNRDEFMCQSCQATESQLQIHHKIYLKKKMPWEMGDENLVTLCCDCHAAVTDLKDKIGALLHFGPNFEIFQTFYNSLGNKNSYDLHDVFTKLCSDDKEVERLHGKFFKRKK